MGSKILMPEERWVGGIADYDAEGINSSYAWGRSVDVRSNPRRVSILPKTINESGSSTIQDLPKWAETYDKDGSTYIYDASGTIYKRDSSYLYTNLRTAPNSHGNGLVYSGEDDYLYYTCDKVIGRYGPLSSASPTFVDDFLGSQGGVPLNTNSLDLESGSSQYASRADTASLSITGDISLEAQIKPESLPTVGNTMALISKWDESGATRSYRLDISCNSGYFGDGSDGVLTISSNTTESPIDSVCSGTSGTNSLSATNASFAAGQIILIHQTIGTGAGNWQRTTIQSYTAGTITTTDNLNYSYSTGAQVRVLKQYSAVTINSGVSYTAKAWDGNTGGIIAWVCSGATTVSGTISARACGYRGGAQGNNSINVDPRGHQGEGTSGAGVDTFGSGNYNPNGNGGGGGSNGSSPQNSGNGGGGGHASSGTTGTAHSGATAGTGGNSAGTADLTTMVFGGGGGGGQGNNDAGGSGGAGGGIIFVSSATIDVSGAINAQGTDGGSGVSSGGGGGAGGSVLLKAQVATLGTNIIYVSGGAGGNSGQGGAGASGRIHLDYYTSYTGTTSPTVDVAQDSSLLTNTTYRLRLSISSTGSNSDIMFKDFTPIVGTWQDVGVSWVSSTKVATFYLNAVSLGTYTGSLGSIHDNASRFAVGCNYNGAGAAANFYDGLIDEVRVFNTARSDTDFILGVNTEISATTAGLVAYYKFNGVYTDATANANNLAATGAPVFSSDVPFPSPTSRLDIDQSATTAGNTYTTPTSISESATDRKTFTPQKDPQKSISVLVAAKGTGNWTVTVHDQYNNTIATKTISNASMSTGYIEFIFSTVWRPLTNFTQEYHFHVTSTVADGTVTTTTAGDLETVSYRTYYQFLVEDTNYHPAIRFLNFIVIGNERYLAKYEAPLYEPNKIVLSAGWNVRCMALWREYIAVGVTRGNNLKKPGRIYFWDGYSPTFNTFIEVPQGGVNAMLSSEGKLFIWAGSKQQQLVYIGGDSAQKVKDLPNILGDSSEVYPQGVCMWNSLIRFGAGASSDSDNIGRGVYTYGSANVRYEDSLTFDFPISTGRYGNTVNIGLVCVVDSRLLIGWKDNLSYGIDYVDPSNPPYSTASIEFLVNNNGQTWKEKQLLQISANFDPLVSGQNVTTKYRKDDDTTWTLNPDSPGVGDTVVRQVVTDGRYKQMQFGVELSTSDDTNIYLNSALAVANANENEQRY